MEALQALAIPAIVKALELLNKKDWASLGKIGAAIVAGGFLGLIGVFTDVYAGIGWGLTASGAVTIAAAARPKLTN